MNRTSPHRRTAGFTLIELLITVAIVAVLASIAMPLGELAVQRTKEQELRQALREIRTAIDEFKRASEEGRVERGVDKSGYPPSLQTLVDGVPDTRSPVAAKMYFLRRIPRDPFADQGHSGRNEHSAAAAAQTWGVRSYASPPDNPRPGDDVYDVYSLSSRSALNGTPYRHW